MGEVKKRTVEEIRAGIDETRQRMEMTVARIEGTVRDKLDWRRPIRERPLAFLGGALAIGILIGCL